MVKEVERLESGELEPCALDLISVGYSVEDAKSVKVNNRILKVLSEDTKPKGRQREGRGKEEGGNRESVNESSTGPTKDLKSLKIFDLEKSIKSKTIGWFFLPFSLSQTLFLDSHESQDS